MTTASTPPPTPCSATSSAPRSSSTARARARLLKAGTRVVSIPVTLTPVGGVEMLGFSNSLPGGFAERMILTEALLLEVPNGLPTDKPPSPSPSPSALTPWPRRRAGQGQRLAW